MSETPETAGDIQKIRYHVEVIENAQTLLVRSNSQQLIEQFKELFEKTPLLADVYLEIDGKRIQAQILGSLESSGVKVSQSTLSRRMDDLKGALLIEEIATQNGGVVYAKNPVVEKALQLSKVAEQFAKKT